MTIFLWYPMTMLNAYVIRQITQTGALTDRLAARINEQEGMGITFRLMNNNNNNKKIPIPI